MSINDLLDSEIVLPAMMIIFAVVMIFAIPKGISTGKQTNKRIYGEDEIGITLEEKNAKIVAKQTTPHPLTQTIMVNMVLFEFENGSRLELAIKDADTYSTMVEGDTGTLYHQGKKFLEWKRSIDNEN